MGSGAWRHHLFSSRAVCITCTFGTGSCLQFLTKPSSKVEAGGFGAGVLVLACNAQHKPLTMYNRHISTCNLLRILLVLQLRTRGGLPSTFAAAASWDSMWARPRPTSPVRWLIRCWRLALMDSAAAWALTVGGTSIGGAPGLDRKMCGRRNRGKLGNPGPATQALLCALSRSLCSSWSQI